ncbi:MAG: lytic murein transglycosylase B [Acidiferrobacterales bacterium]
MRRTRQLAIGLLLLLPLPVSALEVTDYPELGVFIDEMIEKHQFSEETLNHIFDEADLRDDILQIIARPGEAQPWYKYKTRFLTREHVVRGKKFWLKNRQAILQASRTYHIPPEIIVAVIGVETNYGRTVGRHRVIDALTTLVLKYPKRKRFFRKELENYLLLTREQHLDPLSIRGSYTGAIGMPQFMPSSYRAYAVDQDKDGSADLVDSIPDAIGSVANYLNIHGWEAGKPVLSIPVMEGDMYPWLSDLGNKPIFSLAELNRYGIRVAGSHPVDPNTRVALLSFDDDKNIDYRIVYHNFYVITRYNNSPKYARAVTELSRLLKNAIRRQG